MFTLRPRTTYMKFATSQRISLHMWFVFYSIDVLFLDGKNRVVEILENFRPFTLYRSRVKAVALIECAAGTVARRNVKVGDTLTLQ